MNEYQNNHLERNSELIQLTKISDRIIKDNTTEIIYIVGNAGMGKTQLIKEFHKSIEMREHNWIFMPCDVILAKSLNPVEYFFNIFFDQSPEINMQENKANFEKKIDHLLEVSNNQELKSELIRTKYLIGSIINLFWKNSLYDELDAKIRYDNIIYAIKNLFLILSDLKQTFIVVEDSNWMDHDTKKLFEVLFRNTRNIPFTTILLCRSDEDGSHFKLGIDDIRENKISLEPFNKETTRYLVDEFLNRDNKKRIKIPEDTLDLIWKRSKGNPFVLKYVLQYIENKDILDRSLHIKVGSNVPSNTDFFILAKFEMLSPRLKEITEMASILGKNFTTSILQKMLNNKKIDKYIHEGMKENLWYSLSKLNHTFENEYIRKTIYENALKRTRIHKLAARSIEKVHKNNLENYYPDLAYNYEKAEV
nr:AAA family ATPase [Candidatus Cloacimonadota bacterium]